MQRVSILKNTNTEQQGIIAARQLFPRLWIDDDQERFLDALTNFRREWDEEKKCFRDKPAHDWTNHFADALRYLAWVWKEPTVQPATEPGRTMIVGSGSTATMNDLLKAAKNSRPRYD